MPRKTEKFSNRETVNIFGLDCVKEKYQSPNVPISMSYIAGTNGHQEEWSPIYSRAIIAIQTSEDSIGSFAANGWRKASDPIETYPTQVVNAHRRHGGTVISIMADGEDEILAIAETFSRIASELKAKMRHRRNRKRYTAEEVSKIVERENERILSPAKFEINAPMRNGKGSGPKRATTQPAPSSPQGSSPVDKI